MAPPKCFFKRPGQFYATGNMMVQNQKYEFHSLPNSQVKQIIPNSPFYSDPCSVSSMKMESNVFDIYNKSLSGLIKTEPTNESIDSPLDLSCKFLLPENNDILKKLSRYFLQDELDSNFLSNFNLNLESLLFPIPYHHHHPPPSHPPYPPSQLSPSSINLSQTNSSNYNHNLFVPSPSDSICKPHQQVLDLNLLIPDKNSEDFLLRRSPNNSLSVVDSGQDNSSSETSSLCPASQRQKRSNKRNSGNKIIRPFKLYKGNNSKYVLEALGITGEDEDWLKNVIEHRNVNDVFQFLFNVVNDSYKSNDLSEDILKRIKTKFGHIFENCNNTISNPRMIRHPDMTPKEMKTEEYWEKRRKNNEAAKRSREARRQKEEGLTNYCEDLQTENDNIRKEIECLKLQIEDMKKRLNC